VKDQFVIYNILIIKNNNTINSFKSPYINTWT